jgi:peptidoglycan/LPS O-acetylase OafA/YrhL
LPRTNAARAENKARSTRFGLFSYGTEFGLEASFQSERHVWSGEMSFLIYLALFVAACGFGWWAKGTEKRS